MKNKYSPKDMSNEAINERMADLKAAAMPLIEYLNEHHHPHMSVLVTSTSVELQESNMKIPKIMDFVKD